MTKLFQYFPFMEVWVRIIYKKLLEWGILKGRIVPNEKSTDAKKVSIKLLEQYMESMGIKKGDILIVHSSMKGIKNFGMSPDEIIDFLQEKIGKEGMLLMPTYPDYPKKSKKLQYNEQVDEIYTFDVQNTKGWTGIISEKFRQRKDVVRSSYPNNTLAAWGNGADEVFKADLESDLAFDEKSAWKYCADHHAKVLFLGIHAHHSISEIHIAEDMLDQEWGVKGWYVTKTYNIINNGNIITKKCRVRKDYWTKYLTEYYCCHVLRKQKLLYEGDIENIYVSCIPDLYLLEQFVTECARRGKYLIFQIPRKYREKR